MHLDRADGGIAPDSLTAPRAVVVALPPRMGHAVPLRAYPCSLITFCLALCTFRQALWDLVQLRFCLGSPRSWLQNAMGLRLSFCLVSPAFNEVDLVGNCRLVSYPGEPN